MCFIISMNSGENRNSRIGMGEARAWGAVLAEEKGLELKVEQEE